MTFEKFLSEISEFYDYLSSIFLIVFFRFFNAGDYVIRNVVREEAAKSLFMIGLS